jgi:hypothetical protein
MSDFKNGTGNQGLLNFEIDSLTEDSVLIVQAQKQHTAIDGTIVLSQVMLANSTAVLIEPNPEQALKLRVSTIGEAENKQTHIQIEQGQLGIFYRLVYEGKPLGTVYFHQHDAHDNALKKGLAQLRLGVDFVLRSDSLSDKTLPLAQRYPTSAELLLAGEIDKDKLTITAMKARTQVTTTLTRWELSNA